jgi:hypothetical protein
MLRVTFAPDTEPVIEERPVRTRVRRVRHKRSLPNKKVDDSGAALSQARARLLKMIVENERERSHDHRAS